ncbi:MAG: dTDP-4-dehydrorhamnose 3,5-epimerase [Ignavibacteriae bacterium]|nr:dTDP-4-dehydrorhamnose 3,5-epimerase [Ignavibacteriota bacterium]MCB9242833.1 dTDP-4-dehydrorhamnose 3,5-epimerase [Ignavibacteriales bacterium]
MKVTKTNLAGVLLIEPRIFPDERGFFFESYNEERYVQEGVDVSFVQDNVSKSKRGTIRGLHYQVGEYAQGKLCQVVKGRVLDVAADIRHGSPTYGEYAEAELTEDNHMQIWIPPGFAHGFSVLSDEAIFLYKCTAYYNKESERSIMYNDPDLRIDWRVEAENISEKDMQGVAFKDIGKDFVY